MDRLTLMASIGFATIATINDLSVPFLGVPLNVVTVAAFGSIVSFAWGQPIKERKKLYMYALASTFLAATFVAVVPYMMGWEWVKPELQPPFAGLMAAGMRFMVPPFVDAIPEVIRKVFRLDKKEEHQSRKIEHDSKQEGKQQ